MATKIKTVTCVEKIPECKPVGMQHGRTLFLLEKDFVFSINGEKHVIPTGFIFDGASIPFGFRNIFNPADTRYMAFALIHDFFYAGEIYTKGINDSVFYVGMKQSGNVPEWKSAMMYTAVVSGGWYVYVTRKMDEIRKTRSLLGIFSDVRPLRKTISPLGYMPGMHSYNNEEQVTCEEK
jgi:hypothetical protein